MGDARSALDFQQRYTALHDSLLNEDNQSRVAHLEESYRVATKERQVAEVSAERNALQLRVKENNQRLMAVIGSALLVLLLAGAITWALLARARLRRQREQFATVIATEENERKRIAMELHDGLGQLLATARLHLSGIETPTGKPALDNSLQLIDDACREVRGISHNLMPVALIRSGLERALRDLASRTSVGGLLQVQFSIVGEAFREPDSNTAVALYRIVQEIVANAIRHASPSQIQIELGSSDGRLTLTVKDNGKGTDVQRLASGNGIGWKNIQSRVALLQGQLLVDSQPGQGTLYRITIAQP
jgi:signal transduction histidine kinase